MATATATATAAQPSAGPSFTIASALSSGLAFSSPSIQLGAGAVNPPGYPVPIPAIGWISNIVLQFSLTYTAGAAAPTLTPDGFDALVSRVDVMTSDGASLLSNLDGYAWHMQNIFSGRRFGYNVLSSGTDPDSLPGTNLSLPAADATITNVFYRSLQFELDPVSGMGSIPALSGARLFNVPLSFNPLSSVFASNAPATAELSVRAVAYYWNLPPTGAAPYGTTAASQTLALISQQTPLIAQGMNMTQSTNVGGVIGTHILIYRDNTGARSDTHFTNLLTVNINNIPRLYLPQDEWQNSMANVYNLRGTKDTANGLRTGVYVVPWRLLAGNAGVVGLSNAQYLTTATSTTIDFVGQSYGAAGTLQILTDGISTPDAGFVYSH